MRFPFTDSCSAEPLPAARRLCGSRGSATRLLFAWAWLIALASSPLLAVATSPPVTYQLDLRQPASHLIRVSMTVPDAEPGTEFQFPAWNALYQIRDFVRNVQELEARCDGEPHELARVDLETWRSTNKACSVLELRYAVYANEESVFSSVLNEQHAFMNFALLLFYLPQERDRSVRLRFLLPEKWKVATLLEESGTPGEFTAPDYDLLADSPAEAGTFQEYEYTQGAATYRIVVHGDPADYSSERLLASLQKITATATALMQDVPFARYTFILHFPRQGGGGGMEHRNGTAISFPASELQSNWQGLESTLAHEFFHAWIVKRLRPKHLEPVDYVHGNDTRDLWFAEGLDSTYTQLILLRAGLLSRKGFYAKLAAEIQQLQNRPARHFQSVEQAGLEAWLEKYPDYWRPERSISYYNKGALVGFLLDLAIRHATQNRRSLDDVMRRLNTSFARRGRFFTQADLRAIIAGLAPEFTGVNEFFDGYVSGTRELDYDIYLGFAGLRQSMETVKRASAGFTAARSFDGPAFVESVEPGSHAAEAGLEPGDVLLEMNGRRFGPHPQDQLTRLKPGQKVRLRIRCGRRRFRVEFPVGTSYQAVYRVEEIEPATPQQRRVREGWLAGTTTAAAGER